jgi:site-specific DNA recombinase
VTKRAVIYIRTSTERQSEKVSPREQEHACHGLAEERGYTVVNVYRDTERYRVRGKLVEPSGSRADRPALRQMTIDGKEQLFDVILAWKEDRLYRGFRPMLDVLELVEDHGIDIELVRETFDRRMAPVKAWAAKMELESIRERVQMGREGRLKDGKMLANAGILGYDIIDGYAEINDEEMEIVRFIFDQAAWGDADYPAGVPIKTVRRRLIARGYRQKTGRAKTPWARGVIYSILNNETYLGEMVFRLNGEVYAIPVPSIIDQETFDKAHQNMDSRRKYPVRNARELGFLLVGKMYGPCGHRLNYRINRYIYSTLANGERKRYTRKRPLAYCTCSVAYPDEECDFRRVLPMKVIEQAVWEEIALFLLAPQNIKEVAARLVERWQGERETHQESIGRLERCLAKLKEERRWVITQGRKEVLTEDDMAEQLAMIKWEERDGRRKLAEARQAASASADLLGMVNELASFLQEYEGELRELAATPVHDMSLKQRKKVQKWFDAVVERVDLENEGGDLRIQTDVFGLLRTVTNRSTTTRRR